ncbi:Exosome complex component rrp41 [Prototheca wickerhamii]|uniref:Exosome complex component rrp41 n=1 Tax=Prototheca wickerhamii TaxID=3111 RepID=A0AAD9ML13_PROWI|nr:Exosome complex component rrp41 [Prototheca wickerhamii]
MGNTKVLAAVYGPREVSNRSQADTNKAIVRCEYSMAAFSTGERRRRGKSDRRSTEISMAIGNTMEQNILTELLPRTQIDIYVQVLQADGGTRCAAINAAFLALADAGVPMHDCLAACAAGYLEDTALLDLNYTEDAGGGPDVAVALQTGVDQVLLLQADNKLSIEVFEEVVELATNGCRAIGQFIRDTLVAHVGRLALTTEVQAKAAPAE